MEKPKKEQPAAKERLSAMPSAETEKEAERLRDHFVARYQDRAPKPCKN